ncbi:hypothetical protein WKH56_08080 [Priestia sp. SB1]|uniref:Uncharacterized protein n=1 Tax=Priestia aryabhattai TaxID=412384 RepID=A0AAX6NE18_PRIAR|nr:hypothetical protein [Priestia aryabhattai]MDU9694102.1 hypothetical protein [Priestia aryabhattai]
MYNTTVTELGEMTYKAKGFEELENRTEVCINVDFLNIVGVEQKLPAYFVSVTFHNDGATSVLVYQNGVDADDLPIGFTPEIKEGLIEFAKKHPKYTETN